MAVLEEIKFENMTYMTYRQTSIQGTGFMESCSCYERALNKPCGQKYLWRGEEIKESPGISNLILRLLGGDEPGDKPESGRQLIPKRI